MMITILLTGEANEFTMDSLDGFQPERESAEVDRKADEELKAKVILIGQSKRLKGRLTFGHQRQENPDSFANGRP